MTRILLHSMTVHFPIAFLLGATLAEVIHAIRPMPQLRFTSLLLFYAGFVGAVAALLTGLSAENFIGHDSPFHEQVHTHKNVMIAAVSAWFVAAMSLPWIIRGFLNRWLPAILFVLLSGMIAYGGQLGGRLVFEFGIGQPRRDNQPRKSGGDIHHHDAGHKH